MRASFSLHNDVVGELAFAVVEEDPSVSEYVRTIP
jgi:hypothetical protein